jgi:multidrug transporter EmrE-like cation transporter
MLAKTMLIHCIVKVLIAWFILAIALKNIEFLYFYFVLKGVNFHLKFVLATTMHQSMR